MKDNPETLPATASAMLLLPMDLGYLGWQLFEIMMKGVLKGFGNSFATAARVIRFQETELKVLLQLVPHFTAQALKLSFDNMFGARRTLNFHGPVDKTTAAYLCVGLRLAKHLRILIQYGADLSTQDDKGRSVFHAAQLYGGEDLQGKITQAVNDFLLSRMTDVRGGTPSISQNTHSFRRGSKRARGNARCLLWKLRENLTISGIDYYGSLVCCY